MRAVDIRLVVDDDATDGEVVLVLNDLNDPDSHWKVYGVVLLHNESSGHLIPDMTEAMTWTCGSQETEVDRLLRHGQ